MTDDQFEALKRENLLLREENAQLRESLGLGQAGCKARELAATPSSVAPSPPRRVIVLDVVD